MNEIDIQKDDTPSNSSSHLRRGSGTKTIALVGVVLLVVIGGSFYGGMEYLKHHQNNIMLNTANSGVTPGSSTGYRRGSGGFNRANIVVGSVTAISSTSITVQDTRTNAVSTLTITSNTQITDNGQSVATSDIQVGDTVFASKDASNTIDAARILVNPSFGGGGAQTAPTTTTD